MANPNLPGMNVTLNELGLVVEPPPAGPKVTILGITSNTGVPLLEPMSVASVEKATAQLWFHTGSDISSESGKFPGELALAVEEAVAAGAPNVEVIVVAHKSSENLMSYISTSGSKTGRYTDLSGAYDILLNADVDVVFPAGAYIDYIDTGASFTNNFGKQLGDFCYQATQEGHASVGVIPTMPILDWAISHSRALMYSSTSNDIDVNSGFPAGTSQSTLYAEISGFMYENDVISETKIRRSMLFGKPSAGLVNEWHRYHSYPESAGVTWLTRVSGQYNTIYRDWLRGAEDPGGTTHIPTSTAPNQVNPSYFVNWQALNRDRTNAVDTRGNKIDAGACICVLSALCQAPTRQIVSLARHVVANLSVTRANTSGGAGYAGLINTLAPQSSTTNKAISGLDSLKSLSATQANDLTKRRHTTMYSRSSGFVVASGVTGAYNVTRYVRSDYTRLSTIRITHAAVDLIRAVSEKYIGEPNSAPQMNAMRSEIDQVLLSMKGSGALRAYDFVLASTPDQRVLGIVDVNLTLVPAFEVTEINLVVSLAKEL